LTAIVAVVLGSCVLWRLLERRRPGARLSSEVAFVAASFLLVVGAVAGTAIARTSGLPRIEGKHLGSVVYSARCVGRTCDVELAATTTRGDAITIPESSTLTFACGSAQGRLTVYVSNLDGVGVPASCADPRLVAAWPTVMGLPAGDGELAAVDVRNV
jgi:hypothetical protein